MVGKRLQSLYTCTLSLSFMHTCHYRPQLWIRKLKTLTTELHLRYTITCKGTHKHHHPPPPPPPPPHTLIHTGCSVTDSDGVSEGGVNQVPCGRDILHSNHHTITDIWSIKTHEMITASIIAMAPSQFIPDYFLRYWFLIITTEQPNKFIYFLQKVIFLLSSFYPCSLS